MFAEPNTVCPAPPPPSRGINHPRVSYSEVFQKANELIRSIESLADQKDDPERSRLRNCADAAIRLKSLVANRGVL